MIIAVTAMLMVQPPVDEVVDVVAVRHGLVAAAGTLDVIWLVPLVAIFGGASVRIYFGHLNDVNLTVAAARMAKLAIMEIVDVVSMPDS